jgi:chromosome segregation ATPase
VREKLVLLLIGAGVATGIWALIGVGAAGGLRDQLRGALERAERAEELGAGALGDLAAAGRELGSAQSILEDRDRDVAQLRGEIGGLQDELGDLRGELGNAQSILAERDGEVAQLRAEIGGLQGELGSLRSELVRGSGSVDDLGSTLVASDDQAHRAARLLEAAARIVAALATYCDVE